MTPRERLEHRADELEDIALLVRFTEPTEARMLRHVAADLRDLARNLTTPMEETA